MKIFFVASAFAIAPISSFAEPPSPAGSSQVAQPSTEERQIDRDVTLSTDDVIKAYVALSQFKRVNKQWRCFEAVINPEDDGTAVGFVAKDNVKVEGDMLIVGGSKCGSGLTYVVNDEGKIVREIGHR